MKNVFALIALVTTMTAGIASAQVSFTPRVSHNNVAIKYDSTLHTLASGERVSTKGNVYQNSYKIDLELGYAFSSNLEGIFNIGYSPLYTNPDYRLDTGTADIGVRWKLNNAYAQVSVGNMLIKAAGDDVENEKYNLYTVGLGLGYRIPLSSRISLDPFYRGTINLGQSNTTTTVAESTNGVTEANWETKLVGVESHQIGLGVTFDF